MNNRHLVAWQMLAVLSFAVTCAGRADEPNPDRIPLWNGSAPQGNGTFNLDLAVNAEDLAEWRAIAGAAELPSGNPYLPGDANLNGSVDGSDFGIWNSSKFTSVAAWCSGDFNADGLVDGSDFGIWNSNRFLTSDGASAVPEPWGVLALILAGLLAIGRPK